MNKFLPAIGRVFIAQIFLVSILISLNGIMNTPDGYIAYQNGLMSHGLPGIFAPISVIVQLLGGFTLFVGFKTRLSALAPLLAMLTRGLSPASAPTTAPSFSVSVLTLLRLALALVLKGLAFLGGLASLGGPRHRQIHKRHRCQQRAHALVTRGLGHPQADGLADARRGD